MSEVKQNDAGEVQDINRLISEGGFDYFDFGCSSGGSLRWGQEVLGGKRGFGVDLDPRKVEATRAAGLDAILADATSLRFSRGVVSFATMLHFLEHLPNERFAQRCLQQACFAARDFVYVRHPWFDADFDLFRLGYKFYWSDWVGHPTHIGVLQMDNILRRNRFARQWRIYGRGPIRSLNSTAILPLDAPSNSHGLDSVLRDETELGFIAYRELCVLVRTGPSAGFEAAHQKISADHELIADRRRKKVAPKDEIG